MAIDLNRLVDENTRSLVATDNCISRLGNLMSQGLPLSQAIAVNAQFSRATGDKIHLQLVGAHLNAANVVVAPVNPNVEARLDELSRRLDQAILNDFALNATISMIRSGLSAVEEIGGITMDHI